VDITANVDDQLILSRAAGNNRIIKYETAGVSRWAVYADGVAEAGSDAGSDYQIAYYNDAGVYQGNALTLTRATGAATFSGNVGIGTSILKGSRVQAAGAAASASPTLGSATDTSLLLTNSDITYGMNFGVINNGSGWIQQHSNTGTASAYNLLLQPVGGNVGIGTSSPFFTAAGRTSLSVNGTSSSILAFGKGGSSENYILADAGGLTIANTSATLPTAFFNNGSTRMTIDASGNLLVGTTNTANLASATPNVVTDESFGINDGTNIAAIGVDRINFNAGQYYVLNETNDGVKLVNGATSWTTQSDENSKENIVELSSALTAVNAMRCVRYNLKSQTPDDVKIGFIAQDWQSSYPEVVATDTDGTLGMNYTETIPVLLKAIQELSAQNAALTARIAALES
jgi:hypothetical protein